MTTTNVTAKPAWGGWELNHETYVLDYMVGGNWVYEVDLETCTNSAQVLDWIIQISGKRWATPLVLAGLIQALDDVLNLQQNLCSFGKNKAVSAAQVREIVQNWR